LLTQFVGNNPPKQTIFGIDEAGRGPLAGPLSLALVTFSPLALSEIESGKALSGLNDSKKLSFKKRNSLYTEILELGICRHVFISNRSIDLFGISYCIYKGILKLVKEFNTPNSLFLIDGNYKFEKKFSEQFSFSYQSVIKGDSRIITIAAASIIAKVRRDLLMIQLAEKFPGYGFEKNMGYGTARHLESISTLGLTKYHRKTYYHPEEPSLFS
jgi:ribonuclease HII